MMEDKNDEEPIKILMIGDQNVGKSSLILRYADDAFDPVMMSTIGMAYKKKVLNIENKEIKVTIFDSAGHERYRQITKYFYQGCKGIVIVYDVNDRVTFESITHWVEGIKKNIDKDVEVIILANKIDLERLVTTEEGKTIARDFKTLYMETSAKTGDNVNRAFEMIIMKIVDNINLKCTQEFLDNNTTLKVKPAQATNNKSKCCF